VNPKQRAFVNAYLGEAQGVGSKAAIIAGYSEKTASVIASQLLRHPAIKAELERRLQKHDLATDAILKRLAKIVYSEPKAITGSDVNTAARTILQVNGALNDKRSEPKVTVNIGFLTPTAPAMSVAVTTVDDPEAIDATVAAIPAVMPPVMPPVMPLRPQLAQSGEPSES
jgi:hypothetical protein